MSCVLGCDALERCSDCLDQIGQRSGLGAAQPPFDFAPHLFDGIEIRGVSRQEEHMGAGLFDQGQSRLAFVRSQVVHDYDVSLTQRRTEDVVDIFPEDFRVGGPFDGHAGGGTIEPDRGDHGGGMPVAIRALGMEALASRGAAPQPGHVRFGPRLVEEDEFRRVEALLPPPPEAALAGDVGTVLFASPERLFLKVSPIFSKA